MLSHNQSRQSAVQAVSPEHRDQRCRMQPTCRAVSVSHRVVDLMPSEYRSVRELAQSPWNDGVCRQTGFDLGDHWQLRDRVGSAQRVSLATPTQMISSKLVCSWSGSRFAFFKTGVTMACFMEHGTTPDVIDELIRCVRKGARSSAICFSSHVGTG